MPQSRKRCLICNAPRDLPGSCYCAACKEVVRRIKERRQYEDWPALLPPDERRARQERLDAIARHVAAECPELRGQEVDEQ